MFSNTIFFCRLKWFKQWSYLPSSRQTLCRHWSWWGWKGTCLWWKREGRESCSCQSHIWYEFYLFLYRMLPLLFSELVIVQCLACLGYEGIELNTECSIIPLSFQNLIGNSFKTLKVYYRSCGRLMKANQIQYFSLLNFRILEYTLYYSKINTRYKLRLF